MWSGDSELGLPAARYDVRPSGDAGHADRSIHDGAEYHYHAGRNSEPFLCENPPESAGQSAPAAPTSPGAIASPDAQAIADLAAQLNISPQEITLVRMQEVDWPSGALGCPQPDMRYTQVVVNGTFIQLQVGDQLYNYHSGGGRPPFLCTSPNEVVPGE
ncbi:MAG: hypothetical protein R2932_43660 [Caldilineaceae bacterium]